MLPDLRVFISCSDADIDAARKVAAALQRLGIEPYVLGEQSSLHADLEIEVKGAIRDSYAIIFLLSSASLNSQAIRSDLESVLEQPEKALFAINIDNAGIWRELADRRPLIVTLEKVDALANAVYESRPLKWKQPKEPLIQFSQSVAPEQITAFLHAVSRYWRLCGGIGFSADSETEEAEITETVHV